VGIHISKNGISGNILGHKFSAASHSLPAGFPSEVPLPDNSKVLGGGGVSDSSGTVYDAAFAVSGTVGPATSAYEAKFRSAGYTLSNVHAPSPISNGSSTTGSGSNSTSTTVTVTGGTFTAKQRLVDRGCVDREQLVGRRLRTESRPGRDEHHGDTDQPYLDDVAGVPSAPRREGINRRPRTRGSSTGHRSRGGRSPIR